MNEKGMKVFVAAIIGLLLLVGVSSAFEINAGPFKISYKGEVLYGNPITYLVKVTPSTLNDDVARYEVDFNDSEENTNVWHLIIDDYGSATVKENPITYKKWLLEGGTYETVDITPTPIDGRPGYVYIAKFTYHDPSDPGTDGDVLSNDYWTYTPDDHTEVQIGGKDGVPSGILSTLHITRTNFLDTLVSKL